MKGYRHKKAQDKANHRAAVKAAQRRKFTPEMWTLATGLLEKGWTFGQICGRCKRDFIPMVCAETLYNEYYERQKLVVAGKSDEILPPLPKRRKRRRTRDRKAKKHRDAGRGRIPGRVDIDERPASVGSRARVGNWEGDLVNGLKGTGNLVTLAERMTRFTFFAYAATKEADVVASVVIGLLASLPKGFLRTLTFDNGKEFALFRSMEQTLGISLTLPALGGGLRLAASRRPFGDGYARPQGQCRRQTSKRRNLPLKPALQSQSKTAILPPSSKKAPSVQGYATSVALAT